MPPRKRTSTSASATPPSKRARTLTSKTSKSAEHSDHEDSTPTKPTPSRGIRTRRQLLENPDSESGSSSSSSDESEHEPMQGGSDGGDKDGAVELLSSLSSEQLKRCAAEARAEVKQRLNMPHPGDEKGQNALNDLLSALLRRESNSAMLLGPHGTGKTSAIDAAVNKIGAQGTLHVVRLHSTLHPNDKVAVRELVRQLVATGALEELYAHDLADFDDETEAPSADQDDEQEEEESSGDEYPLDSDDEEAAARVKAHRKRKEAREAAAKLAAEDSILASVSTATAHLLSLLAQPPPDPAHGAKGKGKSTTKKPIVIVLDNMDEFALRPKQALLYVLLDAVQSSSYPAGLLVLTTSTRGDALDLLEKRVKSRFSHRLIHMRAPPDLEAYTAIVQRTLELSSTLHLPPTPNTPRKRGLPASGSGAPPGWTTFVQAWNTRVADVLEHVHVQALLAHQMETSWDMRTLGQSLIRAMALLPPEPLPTAGLLARALTLGDARAQDALLKSLSVSECTLLAAALRVSHVRGQETFTLAMLQAELKSYLPPKRDHKRTGPETGLANPAILLAVYQSLLSLAVLVPGVVVHNLADTPELSAWIPAVVAGGARGGRAGPTPITFLPTRLAILPRDVVSTLSDSSRPVPLDQRLVKWAQHKAE